jgi:hypothetical protein
MANAIPKNDSADPGTTTVRSTANVDNQADHNIDLANLTPFQRVCMFGRWSPQAGGCKPNLDEGSPAARELNGDNGKKKARKQRIGDQEIWTTADVNLVQCMSGSELVAAFGAGAFPMPLTQRIKKTPLPDEEMQKRYTGAKWKLRGTRLLVCGALAFAQVVCEREGTVITHGALAGALGLSDPSWVADCLHDLRAWGLVRQDRTWVKHGRASSRRGNVYRLTKLAAYAFGLRLDVATLPDPEPAVEPRTPPVRARTPRIANAQGNSPTHPDNTPELIILALQSADSSSSAIELGGSAIELGGSVSAAPTVDCRSAVPAAGTSLSDLGGVKARPVSLPGGLGGPELRAASRVADLVPRVHAGDVVDREVDLQTDTYRPGMVERYRKRVDRADRERTERAQLDVFATVARRVLGDAELAGHPLDDRAAIGRAIVEHKLTGDRDAAVAVARTALAERRAAEAADVELAEARRVEREQYKASLLTKTSTPVRRKPVDNERREFLEMVETSHRLRGMRLPSELALELELLRKGGAS